MDNGSVLYPRQVYQPKESFKGFSEANTFTIRVVVAVSSSLSAFFALVTLFWFLRMRKRFRHKLIIIVILGELIRAVWYLVYTIKTTARGSSRTEDPVCQTSGFFVQMGNEISDIGILVIAIHSALQVFNPPVFGGASNGLYEYRRYIYAAVVLVPIFTAALPFAMPAEGSAGYMAQGPLCSLPLRPYWYRLALAWVPRYMIACVIIGLATGIYLHVRKEFRTYTAAAPRSRSLSTSTFISFAKGRNPKHSSAQAPGAPPGYPMHELPFQWSATQRRSSNPPDTRRPSNVTTLVSSEASISAKSGGHALSAVSENGSAEGFTHHNNLNDPTNPHKLVRAPSPLHLAPCADEPKVAHPSDIPNLDGMSWRRLSRSEPLPGPNDILTSALPSMAGHSPPTPGAHVLRRERNLRQLRSLFIYPVAYLLMWLLPFVTHCMQYSDDWVRSGPPFPLALLATFSLTSMGAVDCVIFSLREKPWKHDGGCRRDSNASSVSSEEATDCPCLGPTGFCFCFNRIKKALGVGRRSEQVPEEEPKEPEVERRGSDAGTDIKPSRRVLSRSMPPTLTTRPSMRRGNSERQIVAAEYAYARLAHERRDRAMRESTGESSVTKDWWTSTLDDERT